MLELKNINKNYLSGDNTVKALKGINIKFKNNDFVSILGPSGCGKTTLLNIVGGLDRYSGGDLIINGKSTKSFKNSDWDSYRNNNIGFVFQNYNLISHLSVLENVEMALTLSGDNESNRKEKAFEALKKVGLENQAKKRPNQLSGGQMQRVAIARAIVNNPDIILADEPTGALDSKTSIQIMDILKEIAKDRLIIMVTHNSKLAEEYSSRIIRLLDGELIEDSKKVENSDISNEFKNIKSSMSFFTSMKLSFRNLVTKKIRSFIIAFAGSIGIIGIALVLAISNGFNIKIKELESGMLADLPISITDGFTMTSFPMGPPPEVYSKKPEYPNQKIIYAFEKNKNANSHLNLLTEDYVDYVEKIDKDIINSIVYEKIIALNLLTKNQKDEVIRVDQTVVNAQELVDNKAFIEKQYPIIEGKFPTNKNEIVLIVDKYNRVNIDVLTALGFDVKNDEEIDFSKIIDKELKYIKNNDFYKKDNNFFKYNNDLDTLFNSNNSVNLKVVGIIRPQIEAKFLTNGIAYTSALTNFILDDSKNSEIALAQQEYKSIDVTNGKSIDNGEYIALTKKYGLSTLPNSIKIFPKSIELKNKVTDYLDAYNKGKQESKKIVYMDLSSLITGTMNTMVTSISFVLIAFAAISLLVSSIMIGIITYISVLERTKEIGVLRSLGARKKDIRRVFNAETFIIGLSSGILGVLIARLFIIPINLVMNKFVPQFHNLAQLNLVHALVLIVISSLLTIIAGLIPSGIASRKNPVEALRTE